MLSIFSQILRLASAAAVPLVIGCADVRASDRLPAPDGCAIYHQSADGAELIDIEVIIPPAHGTYAKDPRCPGGILAISFERSDRAQDRNKELRDFIVAGNNSGPRSVTLTMRADIRPNPGLATIYVLNIHRFALHVINP